mmetsp:Transcript_1260/g.2890  ORF Transcript_1260/g.2890 Transcript_1260/m.2890 type:complete len:245 (-) Transcript_1260:896-1630(-)
MLGILDGRLADWQKVKAGHERIPLGIILLVKQGQGAPKQTAASRPVLHHFVVFVFSPQLFLVGRQLDDIGSHAVAHPQGIVAFIRQYNFRTPRGFALGLSRQQILGAHSIGNGFTRERNIQTNVWVDLFPELLSLHFFPSLLLLLLLRRDAGRSLFSLFLDTQLVHGSRTRHHDRGRLVGIVAKLVAGLGKGFRVQPRGDNGGSVGNRWMTRNRSGDLARVEIDGPIGNEWIFGSILGSFSLPP